MGMQPKISSGRFLIKTCTHCGGSFGAENFSPAKSFFFPDKLFPICNSCIKQYLINNDFSWDSVDQLCRYGDIPFIPSEFERLHDMNGEDVFPVYATVFKDSQFENLGWSDYFKQFKVLKEQGIIEDALPELYEEKYEKLRRKWGSNYDDEALNYLEDLYKGLLNTQNVNGSLQQDQAFKICKISYEIDNRIRAGAEFDKLLSSYDKLVKVAEFTPKNVKNINDFDTVGELLKWLEKGGWKNKYFDGVTRDIVDETIQNIQSYNQRLYINESSIGEEISRTLDALRATEVQENNYYGINNDHDLDSYEQEGYDELILGDEVEDFKVTLGDE